MQIIKILCDWCYHEGMETEAEKEVPLTLGNKSVLADLCPKHREILENAEAIRIMLEIGRRPDKTPVPTAAPKVKRAPIPQVEPNAEGEYPCDLCDRSFGAPQGLGRHKLSIHGVPGATRNPVLVPA